nr:hypothetical protein [Tanacetum cinerariifolium]
MVGEDTSQPPSPPIASPEALDGVIYKLLILKMGEYILWTMKMEQYLAYADYALWEVILNGNSVVQMTKDDAGEDTSQPPSPPIASPEAPDGVIYKLLILKMGEYILWTMKMEQYLAHADYALWEVILNGNSVVQMTKDDAGHSSQAQGSSSYTDELMFSFFANQSSSPQLD